MKPRDVIYDFLVKHPMRKDLSLLGISTEAVVALHAAGFRILGPDEVDPVTLEKAIRIVEAAAPDDTGEWCPYRSWALGSILALRALGRKA